METTPDHARIIRWITLAGGEISRNRLRRYRPKKIHWQPIESALSDLLNAGIVEIRRNEFESLERGCGYPTTNYRLRAP